MLHLTSTPRYNSVAVFIHWITALAIIGMLALGWIMTDVEDSNPLKFALFQAHKSIGITILLLSLFRLVWRLMHQTPTLPSTLQPWKAFAARATHWLFYALIIILPLTGWVLISTSKHNIPTLLYGVIPWPQLPLLPTLENKHQINEFFEDVHGLLAFLVVGLLVLHVGAALKHHFINKDDVLVRMAPKFMGKFLCRLSGPRGMGVVVFAVAMGLSPLASAKDWTIDYAQSHLGFSGKQEGVGFAGQFTKFQASITFDPAHPETGKITATIDMSSAVSGSAERDAYLPQSDWFDSKKFPQAEFISPTIKSDASSKDCFVAAGNLTIKGVAKQVALPFCLKKDGDYTVAEGKLSLLRTDYMIGVGQWSGNDLVQHAVDVTFRIVAQ